jgi:molybdopterin-binding protein
MALVLETKVLLLDEPTANLDPKNVSIVEEIISWVNRERETTVVMATHNMFQAESLTKKMALIIGGKIVQVGTPKEVFGAPSKHLASFARLENVFSGFSSIEKNGTSFIDVGEGVQIEAVTQKEGKVTIFISPEDIILSKNPITSSARNMFKGRIVEIADLGSIVKLRILAGKRFTVQITKKSHIHMGISFGSEVYLSFKASSVQIV